MNQAELTIMDNAIEHSIHLERFTAGECKKVLAILARMQKELRDKLVTGLTDFRKTRVEKLLKQSTAIIEKAYGKAVTDKSILEGFAQHEAKTTAGSFAAIGLEASIPTQTVLKAMVNNLLLQGAPLKKWWAKQAEDVSFRYTSAVRQGIVQNETLQQITRRVFGSKRLGESGIGFDGVLRRNVSTLVHDTIMQVSHNAAMETYKANEDITKGYYQLSTLDSHTSKICIAYSGARWNLDFEPIDGTTLPYNGGCPRHPNCRSVILPILKSFKELGYDVQEPPKGTRASDLGQIPADTSFNSFLKRHSPEYQDKLLGKGKAKLWRENKINLGQLVDGTGRELTLEKLSGIKK